MDSPDEGGNQRSSEVLRGHQPLLIEAHCANGLACNGLLLLDLAIRGHQRSSEVISLACNGLLLLDLASELLGLILGGTAHLMRQ